MSRNVETNGLKMYVRKNVTCVGSRRCMPRVELFYGKARAWRDLNPENQLSLPRWQTWCQKKIVVLIGECLKTRTVFTRYHKNGGNHSLKNVSQEKIVFTNFGTCLKDHSIFSVFLFRKCELKENRIYLQANITTFVYLSYCLTGRKGIFTFAINTLHINNRFKR